MSHLSLYGQNRIINEIIHSGAQARADIERDLELPHLLNSALRIAHAFTESFTNTRKAWEFLERADPYEYPHLFCATTRVFDNMVVEGGITLSDYSYFLRTGMETFPANSFVLDDCCTTAFHYSKRRASFYDVARDAAARLEQIGYQSPLVQEVLS